MATMTIPMWFFILLCIFGIIGAAFTLMFVIAVIISIATDIENARMNRELYDKNKK